MPINNFSDQTFVAFLDISGFKVLMKKDIDALKALSHLYQSGYDVLREQIGVEGFFVSDSGVLFVRGGSPSDQLRKILLAIKSINNKMLSFDYMLTTSIAYGTFDYHGKLEFDGIEKNPIYGFAYVQAFLDNEKGQPKIQPGQCRIIKQNLPQTIDLFHSNFSLLRERRNDNKHLYFYWNVDDETQIETFEHAYTDSYNLKYSGMLKALKRNINQEQIL